VLASTGTAAALINGSTYHSVLGIVDTDNGERSEGTSIRKVRERLKGVEYIFIDEVSMVSCKNMYQISARLAKALGEPNEPFGGMNMIFAGDFAQLPPVGGQPLFAPEWSVSSVRHSKMSVSDQKNTIGKIIWKQVDTVVILKTNMRMQEMSVADIKYRKALENMCYAACTPDDLAFLRTRVVGLKNGQPSFDDPNFRSVPVITAWNSQKDKLNQLGSARFANDTGQQLTDFYSVDTLAASTSDRLDPKNRHKKKLPSFRYMSEAERNALSEAHPCTSEHVAGKLSLCVGMPVMIKNNDATEL
jgi:hypothetical protein